MVAKQERTQVKTKKIKYIQVTAKPPRGVIRHVRTLSCLYTKFLKWIKKACWKTFYRQRQMPVGTTVQFFCPARITMLRDQLLQQTNGHYHSVNPTELRVKHIKGNLRKRARKEVAPVPAIYSEALVELSTQPDWPEVASSLPTFSSFKLSMYRSRRSRYGRCAC